MATKLHFDFGSTGFKTNPHLCYRTFKHTVQAFLSQILIGLDIGYAQHPQPAYQSNGMLAHPSIYSDAMYAPLIANRAANARARAPLVPQEDANERLLKLYDKLEDYLPLLLAALLAELPKDIIDLINTNPAMYRTPAAIFQFLENTYGGPLMSEKDITQLEQELKAPIDDITNFTVAKALFDAKLARLPEQKQLYYNIPSTKIETFYATMHPTDAAHMTAKLDDVHPNRTTRTWDNATDERMAQHFDNSRNDRTAANIFDNATAAAAIADVNLLVDNNTATAALAKGRTNAHLPAVGAYNTCPAHPRVPTHTAQECSLIRELVALDPAYKTLQTPTAAQRKANSIIVTLADGSVNGCVFGQPDKWKKVHTALTGYNFPARPPRRGRPNNSSPTEST